MIIFIIGLAFLIWFSYQDLKKSEVSNKEILIFSIIAIFFLIISRSFIILLYCFFWFLLCSFLWYKNSIGGADVKILTILPIFYLLNSPNYLAGQLIFLMILGILGLIYGLLSKKINKKKEVPFIPIITLTYIIHYIFWSV